MLIHFDTMLPTHFFKWIKSFIKKKKIIFRIFTGKKKFFVFNDLILIEYFLLRNQYFSRKKKIFTFFFLYLQKLLINPALIKFKIFYDFLFTLSPFKKMFSFASLFLEKKKFYNNLKIFFFESFSKILFGIFILILKKTVSKKFFFLTLSLNYNLLRIFFKKSEQEIQIFKIIFKFIIQKNRKNFNYFFFSKKFICINGKLIQKILVDFLGEKKIFLLKYNIFKKKKNFKKENLFFRNLLYVSNFIKKNYKLKIAFFRNKILTKKLLEFCLINCEKRNLKKEERYFFKFFFENIFFLIISKFLYFRKQKILFRNLIFSEKIFFPFLNDNNFFSIDPFYNYCIFKKDFFDKINLIEKNKEKLLKQSFLGKISNKKLSPLKENKNLIYKKIKKKTKYSGFSEKKEKTQQIIFKNQNFNIMNIFPKI